MPPPMRLRNTLHETGRRMTDQRQLLLDLLQEHGGHLDAHELYRLAQEREPHLNLSTVYRTLGLLRDLGLVDEQHLGEDHHHYELKAPATHYHVVCRSCGAVVEFTSPLIEQLKEAVGRELGYAVADAQVDLLGTCPACRAAARGEEEAVSLRGLATGHTGRVVALTGGHELMARLAALGLTPGVGFEVAQNPGHGPVIVLVRDTRLVLGRGEAAHVQVIPAEAQ